MLKPCGQLRGRGLSNQMTILYHKPYLVKETTNGGGEQKTPKNFNHVIYG